MAEVTQPAVQKAPPYVPRWLVRTIWIEPPKTAGSPLAAGRGPAEAGSIAARTAPDRARLARVSSFQEDPTC